MALDFTTAYASLYSRAASDSAGSALRALVGSIFDARDLDNLTGKTLPYLVWRATDPDGGSTLMTNINGGWYAYVAPTVGDRTLTTIGTAVYRLYGGENRMAISGGVLHALPPRAPFFDAARKLRGLHIPIYWRTLG